MVIGVAISDCGTSKRLGIYTRISFYHKDIMNIFKDLIEYNKDNPECLESSQGNPLYDSLGKSSNSDKGKKFSGIGNAFKKFSKMLKFNKQDPAAYSSSSQYQHLLLQSSPRQSATM